MMNDDNFHSPLIAKRKHSPFRIVFSHRTPVPGVPTFCKKSGMVALTFDEGPSDHSMFVQKSLKTAKAQVTYHIITRYLSNVAYATLMQQADEAGHVIGLRFPTNRNALSMNDDQLANTLLSGRIIM
jgi:peptidoglycan/xylan/chitin deacetylase (PgdA/CDA1 family)